MVNRTVVGGNKIPMLRHSSPRAFPYKLGASNFIREKNPRDKVARCHCTLCPVGCKPTLNPLSPNIHIQILQTDLYTFPFRISWENLIKDQGILSLVIILLTLITFSLANLWISLGENWCWSLLGLKGIINLFQYVWESLRNYFFNSIFNKRKWINFNISPQCVFIFTHEQIAKNLHLNWAFRNFSVILKWLSHCLHSYL